MKQYIWFDSELRYAKNNRDYLFKLLDNSESKVFIVLPNTVLKDW